MLAAVVCFLMGTSLGLSITVIWDLAQDPQARPISTFVRQGIAFVLAGVAFMLILTAPR